MTDIPNPACLVSVIVPAYNAEACIATAVQSILAQKIESLEILVVDDGSADGTAAKVEAFQRPEIRLLKHPEGANCGVCASRRLALTQARGEFVAFLDADDEYLPGKLSRHVESLRQNPAVLLVHGPVQYRGEDPEAARWTFDLGREAKTYDLTREGYFLRRNYICNSTVVCRRAALRPEEDLPPRMIGQSEDWVLWNCIGLRGPFHYDPQPLTIYLDHAASYTYQLRRRPGAVELTAIEFYLCMLPRLPRPGMRLRAVFALLYNLTSLLDLRRGPLVKRGFTARLLEWIFRAAKRNPR